MIIFKMLLSVAAALCSIVLLAILTSSVLGDSALQAYPDFADFMSFGGLALVSIGICARRFGADICKEHGLQPKDLGWVPSSLFIWVVAVSACFWTAVYISTL